MKQKLNFGPYTTYLWTLITILITVAIIFVCTYLPGLLWNMTSDDTGNQGSVTLDLPDVEEIIASSVDTNAIPPYYPPLSEVAQNPDTTYTLVAVDDVINHNGTISETDEKITAFSELVVSAMQNYFFLSCSPSIIAQHTNLWSVCPEGQTETVDIYCSTTVVVQQHTHLWTVTAYGSPTGLTHLSRTPYSDSDNTSEALGWDDEEIKEQQIGFDSDTASYIQRTFSGFLVDSAAFNKQLAKESANIWEDQSYKIEFIGATATDAADSGELYTVHFWSDTYGAEFEMQIRVSHLSKGSALLQTLSISQVK